MPSALRARWCFLAKLPALVALMPPAEVADMRLLLVLCVAVLWFPDEVVVEFVFVVPLRARIS